MSASPSGHPSGRPAAFLDRDGVLNHRIPGDTYVTRPEELEVLPHVPEAARRLRAAGYALVVVTNQRGVARGFMSEEDLAAVHEVLRAAFAAAGAPLDAIYYCPHDRHHGCACRKPRPGMLLRAIEELGLDPSRSLLIGDSDHDLRAAEAAGVPVRVLMESDGDLREALDRAGVP
ncbi:MAG: D-glycero-alpha-D-manno-heptose-1,7-bisphosphate 7-phosphatase [Planctomycetota bacterium]